MIGLGVAITFVIHAGIIGGVFIARAHGDTNKDVAPSVGQFVDVDADGRQISGVFGTPA